MRHDDYGLWYILGRDDDDDDDDDDDESACLGPLILTFTSST